MAHARQLAALLAAALAVCAPTLARAQDPPAQKLVPCTATQTAPCPPPPAVKTNEEKFPFPGETPDVPLSRPPDAPTAPAAAPAQKPSENKFPDDIPADSSSSSSSNPDSPNPADPDKPGLNDKGSEGTTTPGRHLLHRVNPPGTKLQSDDERVAEDLSIAKYYTQSGDLPGALLRAKDAVKLAPDDADTHFTLAEVFRGLSMNEQAVAEYNACLKLSPDAKETAASKKALARLEKQH
jgi:tetratricopeptide (TPR) repeat protein